MNSNNNSSITTTSSTITRTSSGGNNGNTTQACAACKYQRRKCAPDCILAPYFPHDRQRQFHNAHKLFGVSNITKIIKYLDPHLKDEAMRTIIIQSDMRASDPVGGCYKYILNLQAQIDYCRAELDLVHQQLAIFRAQQQQQQQQIYVGDQNDALLSFYNPGAVTSPVPNHYHYNVQQVSPQDQEQFNILMHESNESNGSNSTVELQQHINTWAMQNSISLSSLSLHGHSSNASDEYDHKPILDLPSDDRNEFGFDSDEIVHRSDEAVLFKIDDAVIKAESDCICSRVRSPQSAKHVLASLYLVPGRAEISLSLKALGHSVGSQQWS